MSLLMKKIPTLLAILVLALGIGGGIWMVKRQQSTTSNIGIQPKNVRITNLADNKFTVSWTTEQPTAAKVIYGKVGEKLTNVATDDRDLGDNEGQYRTHHITITKLQPNTQYAFKLVEGKSKFDNNGSPYTVKTAPVLSKTPPAETIYGVVKKDQTSPAEGAIVYVDIPGATPLSTLVKASGNWTVPISVARTLDLNDYIDYDPDATIFNLFITDGQQQTKAKVALRFAKPVPDMNLGEKYEFLAQAIPTPSTTTINTNSTTSTESAKVAQIPKVFNIEPLTSDTSDSTTSTEVVTIVYPEEGEVVASSQPEFRGTGPSGKTLSVSLTSNLGAIASDTVTIDNDGTWAWTANQVLDDGDYTLTVEYIDANGQTESIDRNFSITANNIQPAFEASESSASNITTTRTTMPSTSSGVPVSGSWQETILTLLLGFGIMGLGGILLKANKNDYEF